MRTAPRAAWIKIAVFSWIAFGTGFGTLAAFEPALTFLSLHETLPTILYVMFSSAIVGALHGVMAFSRIENSFSMELPVTRMVVIVWGTILGAVLFGLFVFLPPLENAALRPLVIRSVVGCVAGLFAGGLILGRTHPA